MDSLTKRLGEALEEAFYCVPVRIRECHQLHPNLAHVVELLAEFDAAKARDATQHKGE